VILLFASLYGSTAEARLWRQAKNSAEGAGLGKSCFKLPQVYLKVLGIIKPFPLSKGLL